MPSGSSGHRIQGRIRWCGCSPGVIGIGIETADMLVREILSRIEIEERWRATPGSRDRPEHREYFDASDSQGPIRAEKC